jgi:hypothetical protein
VVWPRRELASEGAGLGRGVASEGAWPRRVGEPAVALTNEFASNPERVRQWQAFVSRTGLEAVPALDSVIEALQRLLLPVLEDDEDQDRLWDPTTSFWIQELRLLRSTRPGKTQMQRQRRVLFVASLWRDQRVISRRRFGCNGMVPAQMTGDGRDRPAPLPQRCDLHLFCWCQRRG